MNKNAQKIWQELLSYQGEVYGYLKRAVGDGEIAGDLFQEVYLKVLQHIDTLDAQRSLKAWLMTVTRNRVINFFRDSKRRMFIPFDDQKEKYADPKWSFGDEAIEFALNALPERQRQVLLRRELDGLDYDSLAKEFNLSVSAVTSLLSRARENLKRHYQLYFLPDWVRRNPSRLPVEDLLRFVSDVTVYGDILLQAQKNSQRFFSDIRHQWDSLRKRFFPEERLMQIFQKLGSLENKTVLDAGSGTGMVAVKAALRAGNVVAVEINAQMVKRLKQMRFQLGLEKLLIVRGDIRRLCLKNENVDAIFATLVLHHLTRPELWLAEAARVLRENGNLIIVDFDRHGNKQLADTMHDLWLGFPQDLVKRWAKAAHLKLVWSTHWNSAEEIPVYAQIYQKKKKDK